MIGDFLDATETKFVSALRQLGEQLVLWRNNQQAKNILSSVELKLQADRWAHDALLETISSLWPDIPIISEEDASHSPVRPSRYWLIDPIDGSASWLNGFKGFVTQAALVENARPVKGFIYAPMYNALYVGKRGHGAFLNESRLFGASSEEKISIVDNAPNPHGIVKRLMQKFPMSYIESGSLGLKACMVASGQADLFVKDVVVRDWDLAPAAVLLQETGSVLINMDGTEYRFQGSWEKSGGFIVARNRALADVVSKFLMEQCHEQ